VILPLLTTAAAIVTLGTDHFVAWTATIILGSLLVGTILVPRIVEAFGPEPLAPYRWELDR
jgi:hypothetical protein